VGTLPALFYSRSALILCYQQVLITPFENVEAFSLCFAPHGKFPECGFSASYASASTFDELDELDDVDATSNSVE
jgi:hypothetical protein